MVHRALIPCGGRGTRMAALTAGGAKELLPVAGVPVISRVIAESVASGIRELLVVTAPGKEDLKQYLRSGQDLPPGIERLEFVEQREPRGLADAIRLGRDFAAGGPLAVALPDNLYVSEEPALAQVIRVHAATGRTTVALVEISAAEAVRRGPTAAYAVRRTETGVELLSVPGKGDRDARFDTQGAASAVTGVGRYVFTTEAFDAVNEVERHLPAGAELDDIPVMQYLLARDRLAAALLRARFLDVGIPDGYIEANELLASAARKVGSL